jgi:hypothetical protein
LEPTPAQNAARTASCPLPFLLKKIVETSQKSIVLKGEYRS